ncbi:RNA 2'-phosphotransferase [Nannocystis bainbridge]|uniref:Probable RNA 2'-phosphotransferase n=1 Tax=Nannocystis bainbridge TaxID=2995303 RepID=A0ABT5DPE9_9BACT|nr:RNA 2'-phosphotransferase [Nannocystis bainbridge]MDC0715459.1 RNA 2'-phosphotransferase [Nannocystis bainbridge]
MDANSRVRLSKFLSLHLRHDPAGLGLELEAGGWVEVEALLAACAHKRRPMSRAQLEEIVRTSDKQRFAFDDTGTKIRANQGHTVAVDLQLVPAMPPPLLFHGTGEQTVAAILREGLLKMRRHHVHLSADAITAHKVGARHGRPAVLRVDAAGMVAAGFVFFRAENGVWLVEHVPPDYLAGP